MKRITLSFALLQLVACQRVEEPRPAETLQLARPCWLEWRQDSMQVMSEQMVCRAAKPGANTIVPAAP
jgi:hypothetical protein